MKKVYSLWYSVEDCGDGSAYPSFFNTEEDAQKHQDSNTDQGWGEDCISSVLLSVENNEVSIQIDEVIREIEDKKHPDGYREVLIIEGRIEKLIEMENKN